MENDKCIVKQILPILIKFVKNPFDQYQIKEHSSIFNSINNLTGKIIKYNFVKNDDGNIFIVEIYITILKYISYLDEKNMEYINDTILTLNYIFSSPIKNKIINDFNIIPIIYFERYSLYNKYILLNLLLNCDDISKYIIIKIYNIIKIKII